MTTTAQQTFAVTYDQLVCLSVLGLRATAVADELHDIDEKVSALVYEIAGPFERGTDEGAFFAPFLDQVRAVAAS